MKDWESHPTSIHFYFLHATFWPWQRRHNGGPHGRFQSFSTTLAPMGLNLVEPTKMKPQRSKSIADTPMTKDIKRSISLHLLMTLDVQLVLPTASCLVDPSSSSSQFHLWLPVRRKTRISSWLIKGPKFQRQGREKNTWPIWLDSQSTGGSWL